MNDLITIDEVIKQFGNYTNSWIFDEDGKIKDGVLAIDTRELLEAFKCIEVSDLDRFKDVDLSNPKDECYTYNWCSHLSHDIAWKTVEVDGEDYTFVCVHIGMDARCGFTYWMVLEGNYMDMGELEFYPSVEIGDGLYADLRWYSEDYSIYDYDTSDDIEGYYYETEYKDLKEAILGDHPELEKRLK